MRNKKALHRFTKILLDFMFYSGILVCASVPVIIYKLIPYTLIAADIRLQLTAVLMLSGIAALYILWALRRIFQTLLHTDPFTVKNVDALRKMAVASFVIAALYITKCLFWFTLATAIIVIIFAIAGLFSLVLADVFKQAVRYKEENDLTV